SSGKPTNQNLIYNFDKLDSLYTNKTFKFDAIVMEEDGSEPDDWFMNIGKPTIYFYYDKASDAWYFDKTATSSTLGTNVSVLGYYTWLPLTSGTKICGRNEESKFIVNMASFQNNESYNSETIALGVGLAWTDN
ncbi:MAG TPA: hypothetical protein PLO89_11225, partial [Spirochaetota bacterium]|nr:hypothetical protein [Spirochaetota bacterium]